MDKIKQPSKEKVREFMDRRQHEHKPPPSPKDVRRWLGWHLK